MGSDPTIGGLEARSEAQLIADGQAYFREHFGQITLVSHDEETDRTVCEGFFSSPLTDRPLAVQYDLAPNLAGDGLVVRVLERQIGDFSTMQFAMRRFTSPEADEASPPAAQQVAASPPPSAASSGPIADGYFWWNPEGRGHSVLVPEGQGRTPELIYIFSGSTYTAHRIEFRNRPYACSDETTQWRDLPDTEWRSFTRDLGDDHPAVIVDEMDCTPRAGEAYAGDDLGAIAATLGAAERTQKRESGGAKQRYQSRPGMVRSGDVPERFSTLLSSYLDFYQENFARTFVPIGIPDVVTGLRTAEEYRWNVGVLRGGQTYTFLAACDDDCENVDLLVEDENGILVGQDVLDDDYPVVTLTPRHDGPFSVRIRLVHCSYEPCYVAGRVVYSGG